MDYIIYRIAIIINHMENISPWILVGIVWLTTILIFAVHPLTKRWTNSYLAFWIPWGILTTVLSLVFRFIPDWIEHISNWATNGYNRIDSFDLTRIFLLDACPMICVLNMFACFIPNRKFGQAMAPISIFAALLTLTAFIPGSEDVFSLKFLFTGPDLENRGFFLIHFLNLITSCVFLLSGPRMTWRKFFTRTNLFVFSYLGYVAIMIAIFNGKLNQNATGLVPGDWLPGGEYSFLGKIIGLGFPLDPIIAFVFCYLGLMIITFIAIVLTRMKPYNVPGIVNDRDWWWQYYKIGHEYLCPLPPVKNKKKK